MICEDIRAAMGAGEICEETLNGARVATHCLYPSFEPVSVFVSKFGDGYRVSDGGGAARSAWMHGRDERISHYTLAREAGRFHLAVEGDALVADAPSLDWLRAAILAVANASAAVANNALAKIAAAAEGELKDKILEVLRGVGQNQDIATGVDVEGSSGDMRHFDYSIKSANDNFVFLSAVTPHHASISSKYVTFADTKDLPANIRRLAVFERPLGKGDTLLMLQVARLSPLATLGPNTRKLIAA